MNLYVWNQPYSVSYGGSYAYAVADSEDEARELIRNSKVNKYGLGPRDSAPSGLDIDRPADRVEAIPYAEIYHWEE